MPGQQGFCGVNGAELAAMAQAAWGGQMDGAGQAQQGGMQPPPGAGMGLGNDAAVSAAMAMGGQVPGMAGMGGMPGAQMPEQASISLSAQAELELELSLRGSLLVQQQRRIVQLEDELQRAWSEIDRLRTKIAAAERDRQRTDDDSSKQPRYWTPDEHRLFMEAVQRFGWKDVKSIAQHVGTRTPTQVRTHAQKLFLRQQKESTGVMAPAKNGRSEGLPPIPMPDGEEGESSGQLQALQEAGYQLGQQDGGSSSGGGGSTHGGEGGTADGGGLEAHPVPASDGMGDGGGMDMMPGGDPGMYSNPDADPNADAGGDGMKPPDAPVVVMGHTE